MADDKFVYLQTPAEQVNTNPLLAEKIHKEPAAELKRVAAAREIPNTQVYWIVVASLGLAVVLTVIAGTVLAALENKKLPEGIIAIGAAAGGALAGLLAPSVVPSRNLHNGA